MKRRLIILALGITFLVAMTWIGTVLTAIIPSRPTAQVQTMQVGSYQITLQVDPNPPLITRPSTVLVQIVHQETRQLVKNARVTVENSMETMDMGTDRATAQLQANGVYTTPVHFSMSGPWQVRILVVMPGTAPFSADFDVTVQ